MLKAPGSTAGTVEVRVMDHSYYTAFELRPRGGVSAQAPSGVDASCRHGGDAARGVQVVACTYRRGTR
jgi:hypothetical protein